MEIRINHEVRTALTALKRAEEAVKVRSEAVSKELQKSIEASGEETPKITSFVTFKTGRGKKAKTQEGVVVDIKFKQIDDDNVAVVGYMVRTAGHQDKDPSTFVDSANVSLIGHTFKEKEPVKPFEEPVADE